MSAVKILISGFENVGKSTIVSKIEDALVVHFDRKPYTFPVPHVRIASFTGTDDLIDTINEKLGVYQEKFNKLPATVVFDTVTQMYTAMQGYNDQMYKGFDIHKMNNKDTIQFNGYVEDVLIANGVNVVIVAHTMYDSETGRHIIPASGQFGKSGSWLSTTGEAVYVEKKSGKYIMHNTTMKFPCRSTLPDIEESMESTKYNINEHIAKLTAAKDTAAEFAI